MNKPVVDNKGYKKVYHCPSCNRVVGQKNSGITFGIERVCPNCKTKINWEELK